MFNVPLKFRRQKEYCSPIGPAFSSAKAISFSIDGSLVTFKAPGHKSGFSSRNQIKHRKIYNSNDLPFRLFSDDRVKDHSWKYADVLFRSWGFWGPWFTGNLAEVAFNVSLIRSSTLKSGSFFHPRAFENAIGEFISQQYSYSFSPTDEIQYWLGPVDWLPITLGARFKVIPNPKTHNSGGIYEFAIFPVSDDLLLVFYFSLEQFSAGRIEDKDKMVDRKPLEELVGNIIDSIHIELSIQAKQQQVEALKNLDDPSLTDTFPPLKWNKDEVSGNSQERLEKLKG